MSAKRERPILFSGPMVRAILDGRKTQTRRVVKGAPVYVTPFIGRENQPTHEFGLHYTHERVINKHVRCPYGQPGDRLWVRETWALEDCGADGQRLVWAADRAARWLAYGEDIDLEPFFLASDHDPRPWKPSIHMPRWASRLTLEVVSVRVERLQAITEEDARAEGVVYTSDKHDARDIFEWLWTDINGAESWAANPWVWVVEFRRVDEDPRHG